MTNGTGNITQVDFGRDLNEQKRRLARLLGLAEARLAEIRHDPIQFLNEAEKRIGELHAEMRSLKEEMFCSPVVVCDNAPPERYEPLRTVRVPLDDYERMKRCESIVERWISKGWA